jgi:hypothetical protein
MTAGVKPTDAAAEVQCVQAANPYSDGSAGDGFTEIRCQAEQHHFRGGFDSRQLH